MMICAQLMAFGRVHRLREEGKEERRLKKARADAVQSSVRSKNTNLPNGHIKTRSKEDMSETASNGNMNGGIVPLPAQCLVSSMDVTRETPAKSQKSSFEFFADLLAFGR